MATADIESGAGQCGIPCGCGARCPLPAGHAGRLWSEHPRLIHGHLDAIATIEVAPRWWVPVTVLIGLIGLAIAVGLAAAMGL
jgi:hypothetical protein